MANPTQGQVVQILLDIVQAVESWKSPNNVANDIADAILALNTAQAVDPNLVLADEFTKAIQQAPASLAALQNGQPAIGPTVVIDNVKYATFAVAENSAWAQQNLGL